MHPFVRREIPTRAHARLDYAMAGLSAAIAASAPLTPAVRRVLGAMGAYHGAYSMATDYELGVRPWLTMRQHLALDVIGAIGLCCAGAAVRSAPPRERTLLIAGGLAELGIVAFSSDRPASGPALSRPVQVTYPPLDTPKPVAGDVFIVDSELPGLLGKALPIRMTVVRLPDGNLLLHSPTRLTEALRRELLRIGPVAHLAAPNVAHWTLLKPWQQAFPDATTWAAPGLRERRQVRRSGLALDRELGATAPAAWGGVIDLTIVPGGFGFHEVALFHRPSRTLVLTDLVLNLEPRKVPAPIRPLLRLFGSLAPDGMPPPYVRMAVRMQRTAARAAVERLLRLPLDRVIFAHGRWFDTDAPQHLRRSFRWLLD